MDEAEYKGVFDISDAEGVNSSERLLMRLCRKSFLSLWSYANLYTDEGRCNGVGDGKEFVDVLVVFGDDVVLFSDKHVGFHEHKPLNVAWPRWYKRAVGESAKQLFGALSWLRRFQENLFLDARCTRPLPVEVPQPDRARYHLVAVTRGSVEACAKLFPASIGSLQINTGIEGDEHHQAPFTIGRVDRNKPFVHVLDEFSLEVVLGELDTVTDFVSYLRARESFLTDPKMTVMSAGEEQLVSAYLLNMVGDEHSFLPPMKAGGRPDLVILDESHYAGLKGRPEYRKKKTADGPSYVWDELVERFIKLGDPKVVLSEYQQGNHETEQALRLIAAESRFRRRVLIESLAGLMAAAARTPGKSRARVVATMQKPDLVYIFLVVPKTKELDYQEYRRHRAGMLHAYCRCAKLKFHEGKTFVGLAFDHPVKDYPGSSEDLIVYTCDELTEVERAEAERFREQLGILGEGLTMYEGHSDEFPQESRVREAHRIIAKDSERRVKQKERRKARAAAESRRRNRRK